MAQLVPYLKFNDDKCKEAMTFYRDILGGELTMQTIGETPMKGEMPPEAKDKIMHASLMAPKIELFASDMMMDKAIIGDNVSLSLITANEEETRDIFAKLSEGGEVFMPLEKTFWSPLFGVVTDKYGIEWMLNCEEKKA
jgi:PhnB protein